MADDVLFGLESDELFLKAELKNKIHTIPCNECSRGITR